MKSSVRVRRATFVASPNIALVKYWGMRDPALGLPCNSSFSMTLDRIRSETTVTFDPQLTTDRFVLNGVGQAGAPRDAVHWMLDRVRNSAGLRDSAAVDSRNNFPVGTGLASSASGFAALAGAATEAAGLRRTPAELSQLARLGSGSACRSIFGGFVEWKAGTRPDGVDCRARPVLGADHWPELRDLVVLVADAPTKTVRSATAMQATVATSPEYSTRLKNVPQRLGRIRRAVGRRSTADLFPLVIEECDEFRRVCETTTPPLDYLTPTSRSVLDAIRRVNVDSGNPVAAYTHDAGAHVHVFVLRSDERRIRAELRRIPGIRRMLSLGAGPDARSLTRVSVR